MSKHLLAFAVAGLWLAHGAHGQITDQFATGNMHFDAKAMDADGDGKITRDEAMRYGKNMWGMMSSGRTTIPVQEAAKDFARGNMRMDARSMDMDHDGTISEDEFMNQVGRRFDRMKDPDGNMTLIGAAKAFSRGNSTVASEAAGTKKR